MLTPAPGSQAERQRFDVLQAGLADLFRRLRADQSLPRTAVVVPGLSLDADILASVIGVRHYEERQLSALFWLRRPHTRVVFVGSSTLAPEVVDYHLGLLRAGGHEHLRRRLSLFSTHDPRPINLTRKILERPLLLQRLRMAIGDRSLAHLSCFHASADELTLAVQLGIPLYACDPACARWGTKSGARELFQALDIPHPPGFGDLHSEDAVARAVVELATRDPHLRFVALKADQGFSGEGNARFDLRDRPRRLTERWVRTQWQQRLHPESRTLDPGAFLDKLLMQGGVVEAWIEGEAARSPSVQLRITPVGEVEVLSTHQQILGGASGQVFQGSRFPATGTDAVLLGQYGARIGQALCERGVIGRVSIDFLAHDGPSGARYHAIEINLRRGGTTQPFEILEHLTEGRYAADKGQFHSADGRLRCYRATDNLQHPDFRRLTPEDAITALSNAGLHFDPDRLTGIVINLSGALAEHGKLGVVCIGAHAAEADQFFERGFDCLHMAATQAADPAPT